LFRDVSGELAVGEASPVHLCSQLPLTHIQTVAFSLGVQLAEEPGIQVLLVGDAADAVLGGNWTRQQILLALQRAAARLPERLRMALGDTFSVHAGIPVRSFVNSYGIDVIDRYTRYGLRIACEAMRFIAQS
jgi:hypothetical protein